MGTELDYDLSSGQWEVLKALRMPVSKLQKLDRAILDGLAALGLVAMSDNSPVITPDGRKVLIRGSSRLWDVAA